MITVCVVPRAWDVVDREALERSLASLLHMSDGDGLMIIPDDVITPEFWQLFERADLRALSGVD